MSDENRVAAVEKTLGEAGQQVQAPVRLSQQEPAAVASHRPAVESGADPARKMPFKFEFGLATLCHSKGRLFFGVNCCVETQLCHERRLFARPPCEKRRLGEPYVAFSLERLFRKNRLPEPSPDGIPFDWFQVGNDILAGHYFTSRLPLAEGWHGHARIEYRVEVKNYEIYNLLIPVSRAYAELCFVDSQISLDSGEINAMYITRGRCSRWDLPEDCCNAHWQRAAKENGVAKLDDAYEDDSVRSDRSEEHTSELQSRQYLVCR